MIKYTFKIDGMKCGMCEAHVCDIIRKNIEAKKIKASHKKNEASFVLDNDADISKVIEQIKAMGYNVLDVKTEEYNKKFIF